MDNKSKVRILFVLKRKEDFNPVKDNKIGLTTGLYNSASFVVSMLQDSKVECKVEVCIDNNCIDRVVREYNPTHVIVEALWVVPTKFVILQKLHPNVKWIVRLHSEMPFMAGEGIAIDWVGEYLKYRNVYVAVNSPRMLNEMRMFERLSVKDNTKPSKVMFLPNHYPTKMVTKNKPPLKNNVINISCFGAVRPLKNHLNQAFAALKFADEFGLKLHFHINSSRIEMKGQPVVHNLLALFEHVYDRGHKLINHEWYDRNDFLKVCANIDIGMQASISETFNIVGADHVSQGTPIVGTYFEIPWMTIDGGALVNVTTSDEIYKELKNVYLNWEGMIKVQQRDLIYYVDEVIPFWLENLNS